MSRGLARVRLLVVAILWSLGALASAAQSSQSPALRIVVLQGEDAVNVIQQKTAVAPVVEIRDRNGVPVAGVAVTFSIQGGNVAAFPGAVSTFSAVTNAAGQATAAAVSPLSAGTFSIQVQAAFQGQTALATIAQANVLTAAEAATAGAGSAATAGTSGAGAAGGGGLSATTLGLVGAAVGGGAIAATQAGGGDSPSAPSGPQTTTRTLTSGISATIVHNVSFPNSPSCTIDHALSGAVTIELTVTGDVASGTFRYNGTDAQVAATCRVTQFVSGGWGGTGPVTGSASALNARIANSTTTTNEVPAGATNLIQTLAIFSGRFDGTVVTGDLDYEFKSDITGTAIQQTIGRVKIPLTLR